jgi:hypothetical protein
MNKIFALHLGAALTLWASADAMAEPRIGAVVQRDYRGAVAEPNGSTASHAILYQDAVFALDTVKTGASATTALEFLDQTTVEVGAGAQLRLDDFVYDPATTEGGGKLSFAVGAFRYVGGKMTTEQNIRLYTPTATMVIRGTELVIYVWPDGRTEVNVISGAVEVLACKAGGPGKLAMTGMQVTVLPTCATHVAAAPALPIGMAALTLPTRDDDTSTDGDGRDGGGKDGEGRDRPDKSRPSKDPGGRRGTSGI